MFRNYFKIAFRNLIKEKFYTIINIAGLSLGISSSLLIGMYILHEMSYDKFHPNVENMYRVNMTSIWNPEGGIMGSSVIPLAESLKAEFPAITSTLRINTPGPQLINLHDRNGNISAYNEREVLAVDSTFFEFFPLPFLEGVRGSALDLKNSAVLTKTLAQKYFGNEPALGKILLLGDEQVPIKITGVCTDPPANMHFDFDMLLSMHTNPNIRRFEWSWIWTQVVTYIKVDGDPGFIDANLPLIAPKYAANGFRRLGIDFEKYQEEKGGINFYLQAVKDIHLYSDQINNRIGTDGNITYLYVFGTIAIFILILASINFMNLTTARASMRAKEIGVKKVLGSSKKHLIYQFLSEAIFMSIIATILALGIVELAKIGLSDTLKFTFAMSAFSDWKTITAIILLPFVLGILAGSYPAFYLTALRPASVLKGKLQSGMKNKAIRNALVIFQFTIAITLMICSVVVFQQLEYFRTGDLGYDRENIMIIDDVEKLGQQLESYQNKLNQHSNVVSSTLATVMPGNGMEDLFHDRNHPDKKISLSTFKIDEQYLSTLNIEIVAGRNFSKDHPSDVKGIIINESAMRSFGWNAAHAIGKKVDYFESSYEVIGVVSDFHNHSLHYAISPVGFFHIDSDMFFNERLIALKFRPENVKGLLSDLQANWQSIAETTPFTYSFLDETLVRSYQAEEQVSQLFVNFTILALVIACIGLFGLASYISTQRSKEIGVRKVLGASIVGLVIMLSKEFTKLVLASIVVATPIALWLMGQWLEQFANKITIRWNIFVISGICTLLISWGTVAFHSIKAALINPARILKDE